MRRKIIVLIVLMMPVVWMFPQLGNFFYAAQSDYNDIVISHLPNAYTLLDGIKTWKILPFWSDRILSGYPFIANPLSGIWYLPGLFAYLFELPFGFNLVICLHIVWGGLGIYLWLRGEGYSMPAAMFGAVSFEAMPKVFAHFFAGHLTYVYAISWLGWLLAAESAHLKSGWKSFGWMLCGIIWGMILLADIRLGAYAGIIWMTFSFYKILSNVQNLKNVKDSLKPVSVVKVFAEWILGLMIRLIIGVVIAAPLILPLMEYIPLTTRQLLKPADNLALSLPPSNLLGLFFPAMGGNPEWVIYPGIVLWVVGLAAIGKPLHKRWMQFWGIMALLGVFFALGSWLPFAKFISEIPGFSLLRVPPRMILISGLAFACMGTEGLETLLYAIHYKQPISFLLVTALLGFITIFTAGIIVLLDVPLTGFIWSVGFGWLAASIISLLRTGKLPLHSFNILMIGIIALDLTGSNWLGMKGIDRQLILGEKDKVARWIASKEGIFRVYSPSYSIPQQTAALHRLRLADGIDPMQIYSYTKFMEAATGVPMEDYSVTLPPFPTGNPETDNRGYIPNTKLLGVLNVRYVVSEYPLNPVEGLTLQTTIEDTWIYENHSYKPRAWIEENRLGNEVEIRQVSNLTWSPNVIDLQANGPGLLVLSEIDYPGWQVYVDGHSQPILRYQDLLRSVELPEGSHRIRFVYRPMGLYIGLIVSCSMLVFLAIFWIVQSKRSHLNRV